MHCDFYRLCNADGQPAPAHLLLPANGLQQFASTWLRLPLR
jgi:hypothetical protein